MFPSIFAEKGGYFHWCSLPGGTTSVCPAKAKCFPFDPIVAKRLSTSYEFLSEKGSLVQLKPRDSKWFWTILRAPSSLGVILGHLIKACVKITGSKCYILWYEYTNLNNNTKKTRESTSIEEQKLIFGWDGINPTGQTDLKTVYNKAKLNLKTSCSDNKSSCKLTCKDKIREMLYKFPRPRDCIVGDWGDWSECNADCGGGQQIRKREVLYQAQYGGEPCPTLENKRVCNTLPCQNPNFTDELELPLKNRTPGWNPPYKDNSTRGGTPYKLGRCEGDCDGDAQCLPGLKCKERNGYEKVPGCSGSGTKGWDYCYIPN